MTITMPLHIRQNLRNLGFSDNDITILSYLFRVQKSPLKDISQHTAISYSTCQYVLTNLNRLNLVSDSHSNGDQTYQICSKRDFINWIEERKQNQIEQFNNTELEMESYLETIQKASWKPDVMYYEGSDGIKEIYDDILETGKDTLAWYDGEIMYDYMKEHSDNYVKERVKKGIKTKTIMPKSEFNKQFAIKDKKREARLVSKLPIKGEIRIYGDKVSIIIFKKGKLVGYVQQSKMIADMFRVIFKYSWECAEKCEEMEQK
jgi:sugar-specific transcriptional regulator TrmB